VRLEEGAIYTPWVCLQWVLRAVSISKQVEYEQLDLISDIRFNSETDFLVVELLGSRYEHLDQVKQLPSLEAIEVESAVEGANSGRI